MTGSAYKGVLGLMPNICKVLELDKKARVDLFLLAQSGLVGRTIASYILWNLCSYWALDPTYEDLSHNVYF